MSFQTLPSSEGAAPLNEDQLVLLVFVLEGFLFQARAFLDMFMRFTCLVLKAEDMERMNYDAFTRHLKKVTAVPFAAKAQEVLQYFAGHVFGDSKWSGMNQNNWGRTLSSERNKVAHWARLIPSFDASEMVIGQVRFDWPTIQGSPYDRFCQYTQNGIFALVTDLAPVLLDLEWKPGRYQPGMWDE